MPSQNASTSTFPLLLPILIPLLLIIHSYDAFKTAIHANVTPTALVCYVIAEILDHLRSEAGESLKLKSVIAVNRQLDNSKCDLLEPVTNDQSKDELANSQILNDIVEDLLDDDSEDKYDDTYEEDSDSEYDPYEYDSNYESETEDDSADEEEKGEEVAHDPFAASPTPWPPVVQSIEEPASISCLPPFSKPAELADSSSSDDEHTRKSSISQSDIDENVSSPPTSPEPFTDDEKTDSRSVSSASLFGDEFKPFGLPLLESKDSFSFSFPLPAKEVLPKPSLQLPTSNFDFSCEIATKPTGKATNALSFPFQLSGIKLLTEEEKKEKNRKRAELRKAAKAKLSTETTTPTTIEPPALTTNDTMKIDTLSLLQRTDSPGERPTAEEIEEVDDREMKVATNEEVNKEDEELTKKEKEKLRKKLQKLRRAAAKKAKVEVEGS